MGLRSTGCMLILAGLASSAIAQEDPTRALLEEAVHEHERGNYQEAYALFLRVHEARPSARTERALGKAAFELRRYRESVEWLEASLADDRNPLTPEMRDEVQSLLSRARAFLGRFTFRASAPDVRILVDGALLEGAAITLEAGEHEVIASAPGHDRVTRQLRVRGGEDETIELVLIRSATAVATADPGEIYRGLGWAGLAVGLGLVAAGVIASVVWDDTVSTLNRNVELGVCTIDPSTESVTGGTAYATCRDQEDRYRLALPFIWIGFAGGAALLAVGIGLILGAPAPDSASAFGCAPFADAGLACGARF